MMVLGMLSFGQSAHAQWEVQDAATEDATFNTNLNASTINQTTSKMYDTDTQIQTNTDNTATNTKNTATNTLNTYTTITTAPTDVQNMFANQDEANIQNAMPDSGDSGTASSSVVSALSFASPSLSDAGKTFYSQNNTGNAGIDPILVAQDTVQKISANIQAMAAANLNALKLRLGALQDMDDKLAAAKSITEVNAITGRIAVESIAVQAEQAQAANLVALATAQAEINRENEAQAMRQEHTKTSAMFAALGLAPGVP
ncbi:MAG: type IV secretion system protein [Janthinobacterium lividum]